MLEPTMAIRRKLRAHLAPNAAPAINRNAPYCTAFHTAFCVDPDKSVRPCCDYNGSLGNLRQDSLVGILGSAEWQAAKQSIERGETPDGCRGCRAREQATGWSVRLARFDARTTSSVSWSLGLTELELNTTNVCNLMCTHCSGTFSSRWVELKTKTGDKFHYHNFGPSSRIHSPDPENLVEQLSALDLRHVEKVTFKGGEPMLNKDVPAVLQFLDKRGVLANTRLTIVTNGSVINRHVLELVRRARSVLICLSVDGVGELQRYIRRGPSENERIEEFVEAFASLPDVRFSMNVSVMVYNVFSLDRIAAWWNSMAARYPGKLGRHCYGLAVIDPPRLSVSVLPDRTRRKLIWKYRMARGADYSSVVRLLKQPFGGRELHNDFVRYTRESDQLWNSNVLEVVPELASEMVLLEKKEPKRRWALGTKLPSGDPAEILETGMRWTDAGRPRAALRLYERFLKFNGDRPAAVWQVKLHRAMVLAQVAKWEQCLNAFRELVRLSPETTLRVLSSPGSVQEEFRHAPAMQRLLEGPAQFRFLMEGLAYAELRQPDRASASVRYALQVDPSFEAAAIATKEIVAQA